MIKGNAKKNNFIVINEMEILPVCPLFSNSTTGRSFAY